jgi:hypothetical protein
LVGVGGVFLGVAVFLFLVLGVFLLVAVVVVVVVIAVGCKEKMVGANFFLDEKSVSVSFCRVHVMRYP